MSFFYLLLFLAFLSPTPLTLLLGESEHVNTNEILKYINLNYAASATIFCYQTFSSLFA